MLTLRHHTLSDCIKVIYKTWRKYIFLLNNYECPKLNYEYYDMNIELPNKSNTFQKVLIKLKHQPVIKQIS